MEGSVNTRHQNLQYCWVKDMDNIEVKTDSPSFPAPRRRHSGYVVRSRHPWPPKSPSTDSTTSLAQLHDKLSALPPLVCHKITQKISIKPELPTVREVSEHDDLSNSLSKRNRFGVARHYTSESKASSVIKNIFLASQNVNEDKTSLVTKRIQGYQSENDKKVPLVERRLRAYQSDTETKTVVKKTRCISPVNKENSPSLLLVATLGTTDESVINDTFDKLCKDKPEYDLLDLLVEEALQNDPEKDSGVSTKRTQESDVIENTPVEKYVYRKKLNNNKVKHTVVINSTTDESTTDVIDDTPCYVYDRKKRVQTNTKKVYNVISEDFNTFDATIVDNFFSQHINENNGSIYVSPTLAKKINETSSEASDDDNADLAVIREEVITDLLNNIIDKVCSDLDKDTDLMNEKQQHIDALSIVQYFDESSSVTSEISNTKNNVSFMDDFEKITNDTKKVTLKFKLSNNRAPKMSKKHQKPKNNKQPNEVDEETQPKPKNIKQANKTNQNILIIENKNVNSPVKNITFKINKKQEIKSNKLANKLDEDSAIIEQNVNANSPENMSEAILTRKKRKLYSPKDDDYESNAILRIKVESRQSNINNTPMATCYKELENARKSRIRLPRKSRVSTERLTSPKTKKLNDLFDKIKEHADNNEKITLADKSKLRNKKDLTLYNLSSESDDQDFQEKKIKVQKRVSSSSLESSANKRSKVVKTDHYTEFDYRALCSSGDEGRGAKKPKIVKQSKPRSRKVKKEQKINLIDERMRQAPPDVLETSFIKETVTAKPEVVEPAIKVVPVLESIPDDINNIVTETIVPENKTQTLNKSDIVKIKKEKGITQKNEKATKSVLTKRGKVPNKQEINKKIPKEQDSATVSPLPGLVVETEQSHKDDITSSIEANLLQKFKKIYTDVHDHSEIDATQHSLLNANIYNDADVGLNEHTLVVLDNSSERSIATVGRSPITGHNDLNELPPNVDLLHERFQHRDVDIEEMSRDLAEFLDTMRNQMNCKSDTVPVNTSPVLISRTPSKRSINKQSTTSGKSSTTAPVVLLKRLSTEHIESNLKINPAVTPSAKSQISTTSVKSNTTAPVVVLKRLSTEDIEVNLNPAVTPSVKSKISSSKLLSRVSSEEIGKCRSPKTCSSSRSLQVVLDRLSCDDINKWLPIPQLKCKDATNEIPNKYKKKRTPKKLVGITKTTPNTVKEERFKSLISPVKLNFDSFEKTNHHVLKTYNTRSSSKSIKSPATKVDKNKDKAIVLISQKSSKTETTEKYGKENDIKNTQKSIETANTTDVLLKDKRRCVEESDDKIPNSPENVARVQDWFKRNVSTSTSGKADNTAVKEILAKVTEALETTLAEMHQSIREKLMHNYLENQKRFKAFKQDVHRKLEEMDKMLMDGAYQVLREDGEKKALMVRLLQEDIQAVIDLIDKTDK